MPPGIYGLPLLSNVTRPSALAYSRALHRGTAGEAAAVVPVVVPVDQVGEEAKKPEKGAREHHPHGVLHALEVTVSSRIYVDEHLNSKAWSAKFSYFLFFFLFTFPPTSSSSACGRWKEGKEGRGHTHFGKDAKEHCPQDEEHQVPHPDRGGPENRGEAVEYNRHGGETADSLGVDPPIIGVGARLAGAVDVDTIESAHSDGECKLAEVKEGEEGVTSRDIPGAHHLAWSRCLLSVRLWAQVG